MHDRQADYAGGEAVTRAAIDRFKSNPYKVELAEASPTASRSRSTISEFTDLCRGTRAQDRQ